MALKDQLKTLVVDDTSVSRALIIDGLQTIGLKQIAIAKDGAQALSAMKLVAMTTGILKVCIGYPRCESYGVTRTVC